MLLALRFLFGLVVLSVSQLALAQTTTTTIRTKPVAVRTKIEFNPRVFKRFDEFAAWSSREWTLLEDVADARLDRHSLFDASLLISGHDDVELKTLRKKLNDSIQRCQASIPGNLATRPKLRFIFGHLSADFLQGQYRADLFDVGKTVEQQEFNCLTATVLYQEFCRAFEIDIRILWEPSHVQCWAPISDSVGYVIETTAASPDNAISPLTQASLLESRQLTNTQFVGKIFYNRGVRALTSDKYPTALLSTWACCVLDSADKPAQSNLRACINNWALLSAQERDVAMVQRLFDVGLKLDPNYEPFSRNRALLLNRSGSPSRRAVSKSL